LVDWQVEVERRVWFFGCFVHDDAESVAVIATGVAGEEAAIRSGCDADGPLIVVLSSSAVAGLCVQALKIILTVMNFFDLRTVSAIVNSKASAGAVLSGHLCRSADAEDEWYKCRIQHCVT
jgi:hypothetical protein